MTLVVAEDNADCRELYSIWLGGKHTVRMAADGNEALDALGPAVDILFLDRDMPGQNGTDVARAVSEMGCNPYVVMVSSMDPDFDIVEMPIDRYVQKPVSQETLESVIDQCRAQDRYRAALDDLFSLTAKLATLEAEKPDDALAESEEYTRLKERVAAKRAEVDSVLVPEEVDWSLVFKTCPDSDENAIMSQNA